MMSVNVCKIFSLCCLCFGIISLYAYVTCCRPPDRNAGRAGQLQRHGQGAEAAVQRDEGGQREVGEYTVIQT